MLYALHELERCLLDPLAELARIWSESLEDCAHPAARVVRANSALVHRIAREYPKPTFGIGPVTAHGREVEVEEQVLETRPFCRLVRFARKSDAADTIAALEADPRVLVCAPLSGHHPTLLRDTIGTLLRDHDVYVTEWLDARDVPVLEGVFHLDDYIGYIRDFIRRLDARDLHVVSVCQPTVPVLAAISLDASAGAPTPLTLTLMGGPIDARKSPTQVNKLATTHSLDWFRAHMVHRVPRRYAGHGRAVYPGFLQLTAFVQMNAQRHAEAYRTYWLDHLRGEGGAAAIAAHERFYDEYNAVLDMDAAYYLDTVRTVFQEFALANGTWQVAGAPVRPQDIVETALFTIEGALDDISGLGQTEAAHALCTAVSAGQRQHFVAAGCGHYGIFAGHRWREVIYPRVRDFVRAHGARA